jgi:Ca2+-transporting ATPase
MGQPYPKRRPVLLDDNFSTILIAVKDGRVIFDNIFEIYRYTDGFGEILAILFLVYLSITSHSYFVD